MQSKRACLSGPPRGDQRLHHRRSGHALVAIALFSVALLCEQARAAGPEKPPGQLGGILVTTRREPDPAADAALAQTAAAALHADPFFYDAHVTVTVRNGILTLHGIVFDEWDLRDALRLARRVPGVHRVVNDLEIKLGGE
ncbi:MAG: BON domain-containing protein [Steroidobacterales bacterium]